MERLIVGSTSLLRCFRFTTLCDLFTNFELLFHQIRGKTKSIASLASYTFSRALCWPRVFGSSFHWFPGFSVFSCDCMAGGFFFRPSIENCLKIFCLIYMYIVELQDYKGVNPFTVS